MAIDFDGTLNQYDGWRGPTHASDPMPGALEFVNRAVKHFNVVVVSSRCNTMEGIGFVLGWLNQHGFPSLEVTGSRPPAFVSIDDRAITFDGDWSKIDLDALRTFKPWWKE